MYSRDAHTTTSVRTSSPDEDTLIYGFNLHRKLEKSSVYIHDGTYTEDKTTRSKTITITHPTDQERLSIRHNIQRVNNNGEFEIIYDNWDASFHSYHIKDMVDEIERHCIIKEKYKKGVFYIAIESKDTNPE